MPINCDQILSDLVDVMRKSLESDIEASAEDFDQLKELAFDVCKTELQTAAHRTRLETATREETLEEFDRSYEANEVCVANNVVKQSARYKAFVRQLQQVREELVNKQEQANNSNGENAATDEHMTEDGANTSTVDLDDDRAVGQQQPISDIDPITKQPLQNPCRNRHCNHVYGMDSVVEALQTNSRMRCPIMGCGNKRLVIVADLVLDKELARKLQAQRAQRSRR